jgi:UDP-arabinose 4-epimerase
VYGHDWAVKWGPLEIGDILDRNRLDKVITQYRPHAVIHFAAFAYVGESVKDPIKYYRNNVAGSVTLLEAMRNHSIRKFIFSSTCSTYGVPSYLPIDELHPQQPINPYGSSKLMIEQILKDVGQSDGIRSVSLRYFNAAGADPDGEIGEDHDPETHLIPLVLKVAAGRGSHVAVFGDDYDTPDGTCIRDYIHVTDLAAAHVAALGALSTGPECKAYNLGNSRGYSVKEVIETATQITGKRIPFTVTERRVGDPASLIGSSEMVRRDLGWTPIYNDLSVILNTAWQWQVKHHGVDR